MSNEIGSAKTAKFNFISQIHSKNIGFFCIAFLLFYLADTIHWITLLEWTTGLNYFLF